MKMWVSSLPFQLSRPFVSHKGITDARVEHVLVCIEYNQHKGYGVAVPAREFGTTLESLKEECQSAIRILEQFNNPFELEHILMCCRSLRPSALSAIDMALHDLFGIIIGLPLYQYFGLEGLPIPPCATSLGLMSVDETLEKLKEYKDRPILKIKMGQPDEKRIDLIRQHYQGRLWVDGNGAWTIEQALQVTKNFERYDIELIEQPIPKGARNDLRRIKEATDILIIADEDCVDVSDILKLEGCVDGVNIKLLKSGGLSGAKQMIVVAKALGMKVMLGCKVESALGVTAMSHLSALADFLDLDGHLDNVKDLFIGTKVDNGIIRIPSDPGLGCLYVE